MRYRSLTLPERRPLFTPHGILAVVLLAELAAILPRHTDRMLPFLGKAGVADDPGADRPLTLKGRQNLRPHDAKHGIVRPVRFRHEVMQRLVRRLDTTGSTRAAIGSTLLRSPGKSSPVQYAFSGATRSA